VEAQKDVDGPGRAAGGVVGVRESREPPEGGGEADLLNRGSTQPWKNWSRKIGEK